MEYLIRDKDSMRPIMLSVWNQVSTEVDGGPVLVTVTKESKTRAQERRYHAMIGDIAAQIKVYGKQYSPEIWKALLVDMFEQEMAGQGVPLSKPGRTIPSMDGQRTVTVRASTAQFKKAEGIDFIEFLYAQGAEMGVNWSEPALRAYEEHLAIMAGIA